MPAFQKFNDFTRQVLNKEHDIDSDAITIALTNTAPVAGNDYLNDIAEISYTGLSSRVLVNKVLSTSGGVAKFTADDLTLTGSSPFGPFRYVVIFNDTPATSAAKGLIGFGDYGSSITQAAGDPLIIDFDQTNGIFTFGP